MEYESWIYSTSLVIYTYTFFQNVRYGANGEIVTIETTRVKCLGTMLIYDYVCIIHYIHIPIKRIYGSIQPCTKDMRDLTMWAKTGSKESILNNVEFYGQKCHHTHCSNNVGNLSGCAMNIFVEWLRYIKFIFVLMDLVFISRRTTQRPDQIRT